MTTDPAPPWLRPEIVAHSLMLLDSYGRWLGTELCPRDGSPEQQARRLFDAPFAVVSHDTRPDPLLNYGNRAVLTLWELDWGRLVVTPSRLTAEPDQREERRRMLERVSREGFGTGYSGVRVSSSGRRFRIVDGTLWNLVDAEGTLRGQAATFAHWEYL
jgi:hypothetical protein